MVIDEKARPIAGARVWLLPADTAPGAVQSVSTVPKAASVLTELKPGTYTVAAVATGRSFGGQRCMLQAGQIANDLKLVLSPPGELRLRVAGPDGEPLRGAALSAVAWKQRAPIGSRCRWKC